jgi:16S rRNA (cytosine967-C5)-methyltransferase
MASTTARHLVAARIAERTRQFPQLYPQRLRTGGLAGRDVALAHAIELTLAAVLQSQLSRPWDRLQPVVQSALLVGAAQLLLLERLPDHAVVNESVAWAKRKSPAATGIGRRESSTPSCTGWPTCGGSGWRAGTARIPFPGATCR